MTEESSSGSCESLPADKALQLHRADEFFFSKLLCELVLYTVNQMPFISSPVSMWKNNHIHGSTLGYSNNGMQLRCKEQVPESKRESITSCTQCKSHFCWTAFSIDEIFFSVFTWFIVFLCKVLRKSLVDECPGNTNIKIYLCSYFSDHFLQAGSCGHKKGAMHRLLSPCKVNWSEAEVRWEKPVTKRERLRTCWKAVNMIKTWKRECRMD